MILPTKILHTKKNSRYLSYFFVGVILSSASIWFLAKKVNFADVMNALSSAQRIPILCGTGVIIVTALVKAWRWQHLFYPAAERPTFRASLVALMITQFVNSVVSSQVGEIARIYLINKSSQLSKARVLGTIVIEKSLEILFTILSVLVILPWVILPNGFDNLILILGGSTVLLLGLMYLLTYQSAEILRVIEKLFPIKIGQKISAIVSSGIQGLTVLHSRQATVEQLVASAAVAFLYVATPCVLFYAFDLPYTLTDAALLNLGVIFTVSVAPGPAQIGVFELVVITLLTQLDSSVDQSTLLSYAIIYHLVVILPPIILGGIAAFCRNWDRVKQSGCCDEK